MDNDISKLKVDLEELKRQHEANKKERLEFVKWYAEWLKKTPNKVWSKQHAEFIDSTMQ